jgi:hypothetical protein
MVLMEHEPMGVGGVTAEISVVGKVLVLDAFRRLY